MHSHRAVLWCALAALFASCAGRSTTARTPLGPVKPSSLEDYVRATYKVGVENAQSEKNGTPEKDPAIADLLDRSGRDPGDPSLKAQLADLYFQRQLYLQAYDVLMGLHSKYPEDPQTNLKLAYIWDTWEQHGLALGHASRAIAAGMDTAEAYALLARIQLHLNKPDAAIAWYRKSIEKDGRNATVLANLGYAHLLLSEWQPAKQFLEAALALDSTLPEAHNNLAGVLAQIGDYDGSLRHLMQAGTPPVALNNMGVLYLQQNKTEEALSYFREALTLDPSYMTAQRNLQLAQRMTPPPAIIQIPAFSIPAEEGFGGIKGSAPTEPLVRPGTPRAQLADPPAEVTAPALLLAPQVGSGERPAPDFSGETMGPITVPAGNGAGVTLESSPISPTESKQPRPNGERLKTSRSPVSAALQQRRSRLNFAGFAGLVILTGWLAFRARKSWD